MFLKCHKLFERHAHILAYGTCFSLPLSLSIAYAFLIPLVLLFLASQIYKKRSAAVNPKVTIHELFKSTCFAPILIFILLAFIQASFGVDIWKSYARLFRLAFVSLLIPTTIQIISDKKVNPVNLLGLFVISQSIAALHTVLEAIYPNWSFKPFVGPVSESGQIGLVVFIAIGLLSLQAKLSPNTWQTKRWFKIFLVFATSLLFAALLINLKRGPWLGVSAGLLVFLWLNKRWLILPTILAALALFIYVEPIHTRLAQSDEHFHIAGGRSVIWNIGMNLAMRHPLGLGYENSQVLRQYSDEIPEELKHFHSNYLNILVETGYFGLAIFLWWIWSLLHSSFSCQASQYRRLMQALGCSFLSWQLAGLVEYNFGDSEIVLIAFILAGVTSALHES